MIGFQLMNINASVSRNGTATGGGGGGGGEFISLRDHFLRRGAAPTPAVPPQADFRRHVSGNASRDDDGGAAPLRPVALAGLSLVEDLGDDELTFSLLLMLP